jgi:hypothetical protein
MHNFATDGPASFGFTEQQLSSSILRVFGPSQLEGGPLWEKRMQYLFGGGAGRRGVGAGEASVTGASGGPGICLSTGTRIPSGDGEFDNESVLSFFAFRHKFSKVLFTAALYSEFTRALTFQKLESAGARNCMWRSKLR